jgi:hypothetical protein
MTKGFAMHPLVPDQIGSTPDWDAHNSGLTPEFFVEKIERADGTMIDREFVTVHVAGDILTACSQPVDDQLRERFKDEYAAWKSGKEQAAKGTPVEEWPLLNKRQVDELKSVSIFTVEALASLSDGNLHNLTEGHMLREKAKRWLKIKDATDLAEQNAALLVRINALERSVKAVPLRKGPGRRGMPQAQE